MSFIYSIIFKLYTLNTILASFRALKPNSEREQRVLLSERRRQISTALQIWLCWFIWLKMSTVVDFLLSWMWFYWQIKTFVLFTFILTSKQTANAVFVDALRPTLQPYESRADGVFALLDDTLVIGKWVLTDVIYLTIKRRAASVSYLRRKFDLEQEYEQNTAQQTSAPKTKRVVRRTTGPIVRQRKNVLAAQAESVGNTGVARSKTTTAASQTRPNVQLRRPPQKKAPQQPQHPSPKSPESNALIDSRPTFMSTPKAKALHASQQGNFATPYIPGTMPRTPPSVRLTRSQTRATATASVEKEKEKEKRNESSSSSDSSTSDSEEQAIQSQHPPERARRRPRTNVNLGVDSIANMDRKRNASSASLKSAKSAASDEQPSYKVLRRADPGTRANDSDSESDSSSDNESDSDADADTMSADTKMQDAEESASTASTRASRRTNGEQGDSNTNSTSNIPRKKRIVSAWNREEAQDQTRGPRGALPLRKPTASRGRVLRRPPTRGRGRGRGAA
ncbi:hypothetical protein E3P99_02667 [Wallemia hederae]|uniref:Uncharacterized protein n=1 Tax=Wallemia hederae TaxID=1540922 RepID=A0A4T0FJ52_9BASI|nr:hypothetical protein E3P99_02667 [Wallemia hederae]